MGYDLKPKNPEAGPFHFGAFSFPILIEQCGCLWPVLSDGPRWFCAFGCDPRMPEGDQYPRLLSNDGFPVTAMEAQVMATVARNYAAIQRALPESHRGTGMRSREAFKRDDVRFLVARALLATTPDEAWPEGLLPAMHELLLKGGHAHPKDDPWPEKIRDDFVERYLAFADWAEASGGFEIW